MRNVKRLFGVGAAVAVLGLTGCAQNFGLARVGFRFNGSCSPIQRQSHMSSSFNASRQRIAAIQARFSTAGPARRGSELASGECRY